MGWISQKHDEAILGRADRQVGLVEADGGAMEIGPLLASAARGVNQRGQENSYLQIIGMKFNMMKLIYLRLFITGEG